jgi:hypothetical protein
MSLSPSFPQGAPTLAEVLLQRTFAKPPKPFADGELLQALSHVKDAAPSPVAASGDDAAASSSADGGSGKTIDVRA